MKSLAGAQGAVFLPGHYLVFKLVLYCILPTPIWIGACVPMVTNDDKHAPNSEVGHNIVMSSSI
jgi:hypothetical protein